MSGECCRWIALAFLFRATRNMITTRDVQSDTPLTGNSIFWTLLTPHYVPLDCEIFTVLPLRPTLHSSLFPVTLCCVLRFFRDKETYFWNKLRILWYMASSPFACQSSYGIPSLTHFTLQFLIDYNR